MICRVSGFSATARSGAGAVVASAPACGGGTSGTMPELAVAIDAANCALDGTMLLPASMPEEPPALETLPIAAGAALLSWACTG